MAKLLVDVLKPAKLLVDVLHSPENGLVGYTAETGEEVKLSAPKSKFFIFSRHSIIDQHPSANYDERLDVALNTADADYVHLGKKVTDFCRDVSGIILSIQAFDAYKERK